MPDTLPPAATLDALARIVGPSGLLTGADMAGYLTDWRGLFDGAALASGQPLHDADGHKLGAVVSMHDTSGPWTCPSALITGE